jgi:RND family efflux transporter MFP subunit
MRLLGKIAILLLPILILVGLGFGGIAAISGMKPEAEKADEVPKGLAVFAEPATRTRLDLKVRTQGEVAPKREIVVAPQISGRIIYVAPNFQEGGFIRQGQVLVRLETADYDLALIRARSGVASAEQRLAREEAEAALAVQDLRDLGISDASPLARREPQLADARASLDAARSQLRDAELAISRTEVKAPFDGRVRALAANIGQFVGPGQSLGQIFATDVVEIVLPLSDQELGQLGLPIAFEQTRERPGPDVVFDAIVAGQPHRWEGRITRTAAAVDGRTRLVPAIAEVVDPYGTGSDNGTPLAPGLFVNATVTGRTIEGVLRIPREALRNLDEVYVFVPTAGATDDTGTLYLRRVQVFYSDDSGAFIGAGLDAGDMAITSPMQSVFDGMKITLARRGAEAVSSTAPKTEGTVE